MFHRHTFATATLAAGLATMPAAADELIVSFVGDWTEYIGPASQSPFDPSTPLGGAIALNPDLGRFDGQFIVKDFDPTFTGTYSFGPGGNSDPGVEFFLHSPILERLEAYTTRIGSNSPQGYSTDTKILLPRTDTTTTTDEVGVTTTGFFGSGTLTVQNGVPIGLTYSQGPDALASFDFRFDPISLEVLQIDSTDASVFTFDATYDLDTPGAADDAPYGFNTPLSAFPGSTVLDTTRGIVQAELDAAFAGGGTGNLLDGKEGSGGQPLAFDPLDGTGTLYAYSLSGAEASVTAVLIPEPGSLALLAIGGVLVARRRRRG